MAVTLVFGCADDGSASSSFSSSTPTVPQPTNPTSATNPAGTTGEPSTGASPTSETGDEQTSDPVITTGEPGTTVPDPSTTAPDPSTTAPDPSTTTAPDPSTTAPDPSTTTTMTTMPMTTMPMTTDGTTTNPDPPNPNQPTAGLYETCLTGDECDASFSCLQISDGDTMEVYDGYCTKLCTTVANCGAGPDVDAVVDCFLINDTQKICGLKCVDTPDCPNGMICTSLALPNNAMGSYCI